MDEVKRARKMARLDEERVKGEQAKAIRSSIEPLFATLEQEIRAELVSRTRSDGKIYEANVWRLVALDDVAMKLDQVVTGGRIAEGRLDKLRDNVGGDDD